MMVDKKPIVDFCVVHKTLVFLKMSTLILLNFALLVLLL